MSPNTIGGRRRVRTTLFHARSVFSADALLVWRGMCGRLTLRATCRCATFALCQGRSTTSGVWAPASPLRAAVRRRPPAARSGSPVAGDGARESRHQRSACRHRHASVDREKQRVHQCRPASDRPPHIWTKPGPAMSVAPEFVVSGMAQPYSASTPWTRNITVQRVRPDVPRRQGH